MINESDIEKTKQKLELIKIAREILNEEYMTQRAEEHRKWLADCDGVWKTQGVKLPYPSFSPLPSEAAILAKAATLHDFITSGTEARAPAPETTTEPSTVTDSAASLPETSLGSIPVDISKNYLPNLPEVPNNV